MLQVLGWKRAIFGGPAERGETFGQHALVRRRRRQGRRRGFVDAVRVQPVIR